MTIQLQKTNEPKLMEFIPFGAADKIKLSVQMVKDLIAVPTKSGKTCSDRDALKFMALCQAQRLNPYAGDAFLVGYDGSNGVATFSLITAHQAFLKRAETSPDFDGMTSGIIIRKEDDSIEEREGDFHLQDEAVIGGWAKVFHKKRSHPTYRRIRMERFNSGYAQWKADAAGMICKCAEADALRSTFPTLLGGLYMEGEHGGPVVDVTSIPFNPTAIGTGHQDGGQPTSEAPGIAASKSDPEAAKADSRGQLASVVVGAGHTFDTFTKWAVESGNIPNAADFGSFDDVSKKDSDRLLRAQTGLLKGLEAIAKGEAV